MSTETKDKLSIGALREHLLSTEKKRQRTDSFSFVTIMVSAAILAFFVFFISDYLTRIPALLRLLMTGTLVGIFLVWLPKRWVGMRVRRESLADIARDVERQAAASSSGGFMAVLVSAVEFATRGDILGSDELKSLVVKRARTPHYNPKAVALRDRRILVLARKLSLAAGLVLLLWGGLAPNSLITFLQRSLGFPVEYLTATLIEHVDYPEISPQFEDVQVVVSAGGVIPGEGRLRIRREGESTFYIPLEAGEAPGEFIAVVESPPRSFRFDINLGDARHPTNTVRVVRPPFVEEGTIAIVPPEYTGLESYQRELGNFEVLANSQFSINVKPDREVAECRVILNDREFATTAGEGASFALGARLHDADRALRYSIKLVDNDGIENSRRMTYSLFLIRDNQPSINISEPEPGAYFAPSSTMRWRTVITDDYGIEEARLRYTVIEVNEETGEERRLRENFVELGTFDARRVASLSGEVRIRDWKVIPGQSLELTVLARDNNSFRDDEDIWAESAPRMINIVSEAQLRSIIDAEARSAHNILRDIRDDITIKTRVIDMMDRERK